MNASNQISFQRLFVALDFPENIVTDLSRIRPRPVSGMRPVERNQLHLTLHFLGESDLDRTRAVLFSVSRPPFSLTIEGVGEFKGNDGSGILWAGIRPCTELLQLHSAAAEALSDLGFVPESRPYSPHITLARYKPNRTHNAGDQPEEVHRFHSENSAFCVADIPIKDFSLYSSNPAEIGREYRCEQNYLLK